MKPAKHINASEHSARIGVIFINIGSLLAQIVQIAGYPTLLALSLARASYPSWLIGTILSFQWVIVLLLAPLVPVIIKRSGTRLASQTGAAISAFSLVLLMFSSWTSAIIASALLMGMGLTIRWVACDTWIVEAVSAKLRGRAIGIHETLMGLGIAIGPLLTMVSNGNEIAAIAGYIILLLLAAICFSFGTHIATGSTIQDKPHRHLLAVFRILVLALLAALASGYIETTVVSLLPLYLIAFHYPEAQTLMLLSVFGLGGTLLQAPLGWFADRYSFRAGQVLCLTLIIISGALLLAVVAIPWAVLVILFIWGGCVGGLNTLAVIEAGSTLKPGASASGMALIASSYTLGGVIGPIMSGSTLHLVQGHGAILVIIGLMVVYAAILAVASHRSGRSSAEDAPLTARTANGATEPAEKQPILLD